jgi:hypothetical protein
VRLRFYDKYLSGLCSILILCMAPSNSHNTNPWCIYFVDPPAQPQMWCCYSSADGATRAEQTPWWTYHIVPCWLWWWHNWKTLVCCLIMTRSRVRSGQQLSMPVLVSLAHMFESINMMLGTCDTWWRSSAWQVNFCHEWPGVVKRCHQSCPCGSLLMANHFLL